MAERDEEQTAKLEIEGREVNPDDRRPAGAGEDRKTQENMAGQDLGQIDEADRSGANKKARTA